eukprot:1137710-Pelagomonas_calceolata.AAC.5
MKTHGGCTCVSASNYICERVSSMSACAMATSRTQAFIHFGLVPCTRAARTDAQIVPNFSSALKPRQLTYRSTGALSYAEPARSIAMRTCAKNEGEKW